LQLAQALAILMADSCRQEAVALDVAFLLGRQLAGVYFVAATLVACTLLAPTNRQSPEAPQNHSPSPCKEIL